MTTGVNSLKDTIVTNLHSYYYLESILNSHLLMRLERPDFLENPLIRSIYGRKSPAANTNNLLASVANSGFDISRFSKRISAGDKNFDWKIYDWIAEVYAIQRLQSAGFRNIDFLDEFRTQKSADVVIYSTGGSNYCEIKNIRELDNLFIGIQNRYESNSIIYPNKFPCKPINITATSSSIAELEDFNPKRIEEFWNPFVENLKSGYDNFTINCGTVEFEIEVWGSQSVHRGLIFSKRSKRFEDSIIDLPREYIYFGDVYWKFLKSSYEGYQQLVSTRAGDTKLVCKDYLYIHVMVDGGKLIFYETSFKQKMRNIIEAVELKELVNVMTNFDDS